MYEKVDTGLDFAGREQSVLAFWRENKIFEQSVAIRKDAPIFTFYDGPPTANGKPHIGHILTRAVKDIIPRYKTMKGYRVPRKAGWDTHGLPVELEVEKVLGITGKPDIESYGVEAFNKKCKESVWVYEGLWHEMSERVGYWADMENPYVTFHNEYIESVWWALSQIWQKDLIYKGYRVVPYCPRCGTALSSHEVAQGYADVKETSVFVRFKLKGDDPAYMLAWTTTPWTLPSNVALCVNPREDYVRAQCGGDVYILAKALAENLLPKGYTILASVKGSELAGLAYEPLFDFALTDAPNYCTVVCDDYVTLTDGAGVVHIAPAFGEDDSRIGKVNELPLIQLVNEQGRFVEAVAPWAGLFVKDADPLIIASLKEKGLLFKTQDYEHSYPFCWRCKTPLLYYARDAWFIRVTALRDKLVENNNTVNWLPDNVRTGRFGNFLENVIDWSISRERYWGTPLPIWECDCGHRHCVGSIAELKQMGQNVPEDIELHKPYIDEVLLTCPQCGGAMKRVPEVIDCWFDAGSMPFAQWHYPFENTHLFEEQFPADYISEAVDQTRGWFYALIAISTLLFERSSYKNVIVLGHVQDENGLKMSKHLGNVVDPMEALAKHGADAVRWYFFVNSAPWLNTRYSDAAVVEAQRKFMGTLWNTYAFYVLYANIDQFDPAQYPQTSEPLSVMDKWILSRLNTLVKRVDSCLARYELTEPARALTEFTDELSNWYVRRCRDRFWGSGMSTDKINAYQTLRQVLVTTAKTAAPFVPFMTELIYRNLVCRVDKEGVEPISVHLCDYPAVDERAIDTALEAEMKRTLQYVTLGRAARNAANIKNRQPLAEMLLATQEKPLSAAFVEIIRDELNVKAVSFTETAEAFTQYRFKPQLRTLGPRYGRLVPKITEALNVDGNASMAQLKQGEWRREIEGVEVILTEADVLPELTQKEGYMSQTERGVTVVLDIRLTAELMEEGYVRELVSKLQTMRRDAGFEVTDRIRVYFSQNDILTGIFERNGERIASEVLADRVEPVLAAPGAKRFEKEWKINDEVLTLWVEKI